MHYTLLLLRYNELALKARKTRKHFENILVKNISFALEKNHITNKIKREYGRLYVYTSHIEEAIPVLLHIFGVFSVSPAIHTDSTLSTISQNAEQLVHEILTPQKSFAIRATRTGDHSFSSQDIAIQVGDVIRKKTQASVDLSKPDVTLGIDIRQETTYLFLNTFQAAGGLPLGTQGSIGAFITSSNALVATWFLMKRGCTPVLFVTPDVDIEKVTHFLSSWYTQTSIQFLDDSSQKSLKAALKSHDCQALVVDTVDVTGISLTHLQQLKTQLDVPILTPLLGCSSKDLKFYHEHSEVPT